MYEEIAFARALEAIAMGETRETTREALRNAFPLTPNQLDTVLRDTYSEALQQGVEREDIDESWHTPERI